MINLLNKYLNYDNFGLVIAVWLTLSIIECLNIVEDLIEVGYVIFTAIFLTKSISNFIKYFDSLMKRKQPRNDCWLSLRHLRPQNWIGLEYTTLAVENNWYQDMF